jgi:class 3 adenylate cyclase
MQPDPETERELRELLARRIASYTAGSVDTEMGWWSPDPDIVYISTGSEEFRRGHDEIRALRASRFEQATARGIELTRDSYSVEGDVAWYAGEGESWASVNGIERRWPVRVTVVMVRRDGRWMLAQQHTSTPAITQQAGEAFPRPIETLIAALEHERPDLRPQASSEGVVTLLFTDIEGSTLMNDEIGDQRWIALLREHNEIVRERIGAHGGSEVKTIGDAFMVAFASPRRAVLCAIDLQRAFAAYARQGRGREHVDAPLRIRIGLHVGEPVREGGDFYGKSVTLASRIADQAKGGEILVSTLLKGLTEAGGDIAFGDAREAELKGFAERQRLFAIDWGQLAGES